MRVPLCVSRLNLVGDYVRRSVAAFEHGVGFVVVEDLLGFRVEAEAAAEAVDGIGEMYQRCGFVRFFDGRVDVFGAAAANTVDEVGVVIPGLFASRAGLDFDREPGLVGVITIYGEVAVGAVEDVAHGIGLGVLGAERSRLAGFFVGRFVFREAGGRDAAGSVGPGADFVFGILDPL